MTAQPDLFGVVKSRAVLSDCGTYRYQLGRQWGQGSVLAWVMLNPSTADAEQDDPTVRRCVGFARDWGYSGIVVVNLFALRATDPAELATHPDPIGPDNDDHLRAVASGARAVICAWGAHPFAADRALVVTETLRRSLPRNSDLLCLGTTKNRAPRHPLYVKGATSPAPFEGWEAA